MNFLNSLRGGFPPKPLNSSLFLKSNFNNKNKLYIHKVLSDPSYFTDLLKNDRNFIHILFLGRYFSKKQHLRLFISHFRNDIIIFIRHFQQKKNISNLHQILNKTHTSNPTLILLLKDLFTTFQNSLQSVDSELFKEVQNIIQLYSATFKSSPSFFKRIFNKFFPKRNKKPPASVAKPPAKQPQPPAPVVPPAQPPASVAKPQVPKTPAKPQEPKTPAKPPQPPAPVVPPASVAKPPVPKTPANVPAPVKPVKQKLTNPNSKNVAEANAKAAEAKAKAERQLARKSAINPAQKSATLKSAVLPARRGSTLKSVVGGNPLRDVKTQKRF